MNIRLIISGAFVLGSLGHAQTLYQNNFEQAQLGKVPEDFMVLDGGFTVKQEDGNKLLELPGAPLDTFAVLFGPAQTENVSVSARIKSSAKGRRYPTFGVGLNGTAGYKLQVSPAKKLLELYKDQDLKASVAYEWKSGQWTKLLLQIHKLRDGLWQLQGKAWLDGSPDPATSMLTADEKEPPSAGRPSVFGSPFSGAPIQFDDLLLSTSKP